ncbi:MAG: VCBS repeat-containing protein [Planctomycetales bacterium]|nr:VCBS repeat-containing protein [Planctomycetales bacterium]
MGVYLCSGALSAPAQETKDLTPLKYGQASFSVDLGVGLWAWPMPIDWDQDGDFDLVVSCPDKPYSGTYFFENPGQNTRGNQSPDALPVFKQGVRVGHGMKNVQISFVAGQPRILEAEYEYLGFLGDSLKTDATHRKQIFDAKTLPANLGNRRFTVTSYVDYDGDEKTDLMVGVDDWGYYGWDDGFDAQGNWKRGPLHGYVYILLNQGTNELPDYAPPFRVQAAGKDLNVYGNPQPNMADFDQDGDLDLICAEFLDGFSYFENIGTRTQPRFSAGSYLTRAGSKLQMHVQMITPCAVDWDHDGDMDIVCGDEDGRVALLRNTGQVANHQPQFDPPQYFQQQADELKFGALVTPVGIDFDSDGDEDLVCGNTSGNIGWFENTDGGSPPTFAPVCLIEADGAPIHIQAGPQGSIQGPAEAKWGYTTFSVADWDHDGLLDIVANSIWGKIIWYKNIGTASKPKFSAAQSIEVAWKSAPPKPTWVWWQPGPSELVTQWRTTPVVVDWDQDGLNDLLLLDHEGYLAFWKRERENGELKLLPGARAFRGQEGKSKTDMATAPLLRLNAKERGGSGRRKMTVVDWDGDGRQDLILNSTNATWLRNVADKDGVWWLEGQGNLSSQVLAGHTTSPTTVDWDQNGTRDLVLGAEDGRLYFLRNPHSK